VRIPTAGSQGPTRVAAPQEDKSRAEGDRQGRWGKSPRCQGTVPWCPSQEKRAGPMTVNSHGPVMARQVCSDDLGSRSSQQLRDRICQVHG